MIEDVEELDPELGVVSLLEREVLEYGEIHVLEARVAEDVPAHRSKGSKHGRNQHRVAVHVAASGPYPFCLVACQGVDVGGDAARTGERRGERGYEAAHLGCAAALASREILPAAGDKVRLD